MTPGNSLYKIKCVFITVFMLGMIFRMEAQRKMDAKGGLEAFLDTQWWLGLRAGTNFTQPTSETFYSVISAIDYETDNLQKDYEAFQSPGIQMGLDLTYYHRGLSIGVLPTFKRYRYNYNNALNWITEAEVFETKYQIKQNLDYLEIPLIMKYDILRSGNLRPFLQAGLQWAFSIGAEKSLTVTHQEGTPAEASGGTLSIDTKKDFKGFLAVIGGMGVSYDIGNIRTVLDLSYQYGLSGIVEENQLFSESQLIAVGDINDDLRLRNIQASLSFLFPLRFIDTTFKSGK